MKLTALLSIAMIGPAFASAAMIIDFAGSSVAPTTSFSYSEDGYDFTINQVKPDGSLQTSTNQIGIADAATATSEFGSAVTTPLLYADNNGSHFEMLLDSGPVTNVNLTSIDVANGTYGSRDGTITGFLLGGGTVTQDFTIGSRTSMTITLAGFNGVTGFNIVPQDGAATNHRYGADNITFAPVPEPSIYAAIAGMFGMGLAILRRRK